METKDNRDYLNDWKAKPYADKPDLLKKRTLLAFVQKYMRHGEHGNSEETAKKQRRVLLSSLLSGEIAPGEFAQRVKESGVSTRVLSVKEKLQERMEFLGSDAKLKIGKEEHTYREAFDRFQELETQIADFFKAGGGTFVLPFSNDPDAIINKLSDPELPEEERLLIWERYCKRWG